MFKVDLRFCVICSHPVHDSEEAPKTDATVFPGSEGSPIFNHFLYVYFITRKLFKLSEKRCVQILKSLSLSHKKESNQLRQFELCENCECIVEKAVDCHRKILSLQQEINVLGETLLKLVDKNVGNPDDTFNHLKKLIYANALTSDQRGFEAHLIKEEPDQFSDVDEFATDYPVIYDDDNPNDYEAEQKRNKFTPTIKTKMKKSMEECDSDYSPRKASFEKRKKVFMIGNRKKILKGKYRNIVIDRKKTRFPCNFCSTIYTSPHGFKKHLLAHEESDRLGNIFDCPKCKHPNLSEEKLRRHLTKTHDTQKNKCRVCGHVALRRWLHDKHMLHVHNIKNWIPIVAKGSEQDSTKNSSANASDTYITGKTFNCENCESVYSTLPGIVKHKKIHEESNRMGNIFDCQICRHPNVSDKNLARHLKRFHGQQDVEEEDLGGNNVTVKQEINNENDKSVITNAEGETESKPNFARQFHCELCASVYTSPHGFKKHQRVHKASALLDNKYDCAICRHPTTSEGNLRRHLTLVHNVSNQQSLLAVRNAEQSAVLKKDEGASCITIDSVENISHCLEKNERSKRRQQNSSKISENYDQSNVECIEEAIEDEPDVEDDEWHPSEDDSDAKELASKKLMRSDDDEESDDGDSDFEFTPRRRSRSSVSNTYVCKKCNVAYKSLRGFRRHEEEHKKSIALNHKYDCSKCGFPASCERKLRYHKIRVHQEITLLTCSLCGYQVLRPSQLRRHMKKHNSSQPKKKIGRKPKWIETDGIFSCKLCKATYKSASALYRHTQEHAKSQAIDEKFSCNLCNFPCLDENALRRHKRRSHKEKNVVCHICQKTFLRNNILQAHLDVHERYDRLIDPKTGLYQCPVCPYQGSMQGVIIHRNSKHLDVNLDPSDKHNHLCNQCGLSFTTAPSLRTHIKNKHENRFRYRCEFCGKGFESKTAFQCHKKTHDKVRVPEFVCSFCGTAYTHKKTLEDHLVKFHPDHVDQPSTSQNLRAQKPGNHKCKWCPMVFPFKYLLVNHVPSAHQDLYKFKCEICSKTYISDRSLILHKEIVHSNGALSYSCEFCGKEFRHKHYVTCHYRFCSVKKGNTSDVKNSTNVKIKTNNSKSLFTSTSNKPGSNESVPPTLTSESPASGLSNTLALTSNSSSGSELSNRLLHSQCPQSANINYSNITSSESLCNIFPIVVSKNE